MIKFPLPGMISAVSELTADSKQTRLAEWERSLQVTASRITGSDSHTQHEQAPRQETYKTRHMPDPARVDRAPKLGQVPITAQEGSAYSATTVSRPAAAQARTLYAAGPTLTLRAGVISDSPGRGATLQLRSTEGRQLAAALMLADVERSRQRLALLQDEKIVLLVRDYESPDAQTYKSGAKEIRQTFLALGLQIHQVLLNGSLIFDKEKDYAH